MVGDVPAYPPTKPAADFDRGRRMARRRMAWWSFVSLFLDMGIIFGGLLFGPAGFAAGITAASGIMGTIIAARVAIIMSYLGVSAWERISTAAKETAG